jgi:hypothetical protein
MKEAAANNPFPNSPTDTCSPGISSCANGDYLPSANNRIPDSATAEQITQAIEAEKAVEFNSANHDDIDGMINVGKSFSEMFRDYALVAGPEAVFADLPVAAAGKAADTAVADTAVDDTAAAGKAAGTTSQVLSPLEQTVAQEAQGILESKELDALRAAYESGKPTEVVIDGRTIVYATEYSGSGMILFGEDGFVLGNHAFSSEEELTKTLLHELHRLNTSASGMEGVSGELAGSETAAAQKFANDVYAKGKSGGLW